MAMSRICNLFLALPVAVYGGSATAVRPIVNTSSFGGSVSGFTFPELAGAKAQVSADLDNNPAILVFDGEKMVHVINSSTSVHGFPSGKITSTGISSISHSKEGVVSFAATVVAGTESFDGVFVASPYLFDSAAVPVITTQGAAGYTSFGSATVAVSKDRKSIVVAFVAEMANSSAVMSADVDIGTGAVGTPRVLVKTGDTIPGSGALPFLCISNPAVSESGDVVFFGSHCSDGAGSAAISAQAATRKMYRTKTEATHCLHLGADRIFPGIFSVGEAGVKVVASAATAAPGVNGANFTAFSDPSIGADGTVAFVAETEYGLGIYAKEAGSNDLRLVADTNTTLASGATFGDFPEPPSVGDGRVAYYAKASGSFSGVYLEAQGDEISSKNEPVPLLTMADSAMGSGIVFIGFGQHSYDETNGEVGVYLVLDNTAMTDGIYSLKEASTTTII